MYGRAVAHYHENPYTHQPNEHPNDPLERHIPFGWQHVTSVYGPVFTLTSAGFAEIAGTSQLANRLLQQGLEALVVVAMCIWILRKRPESHPWLVLGLNPAVVAIVNGGHNDLLMGAFVAVGAYLANNNRPWQSSVVLGLALLIKASAIFGVIGVLLWLGSRNRKRVAEFSLTPIITVVAGYAAVGGTSGLRALTNNSNYTSRASLLALPTHIVRSIAGNDAASHAATIFAIAVFLTLVWFWYARSKAKHERSAEDVATTFTNASTFASPYVLQWYSGWALPLATIDEGIYSSEVALLQSGALLTAYAVPAGVHTDPLVSTISALALPVCLLAAFWLRERSR